MLVASSAGLIGKSRPFEPILALSFSTLSRFDFTTAQMVFLEQLAVHLLRHPSLPPCHVRCSPCHVRSSSPRPIRRRGRIHHNVCTSRNRCRYGSRSRPETTSKRPVHCRCEPPCSHRRSSLTLHFKTSAQRHPVQHRSSLSFIIPQWVLSLAHRSGRTMMSETVDSGIRGLIDPGAGGFPRKGQLPSKPF